MTSRPMRAVAPLAAVLLLAAAPAAAETIDREFHESFDVAAGDRLELHFGDGDVEIDPFDLDLGPGVSARFTIDTDDGRIRVEGAPVDLSRQRHYASGTLGAGEGTIRVLTQDGGVTLRHQPPARPAERPVAKL